MASSRLIFDLRCVGAIAAESCNDVRLLIVRASHKHLGNTTSINIRKIKDHIALMSHAITSLHRIKLPQYPENLLTISLNCVPNLIA